MTERDAAIGDGGSDMSGTTPREPMSYASSRTTSPRRGRRRSCATSGHPAPPAVPDRSGDPAGGAWRSGGCAPGPCADQVVRRSVARTAALRESLAEKEAEANELRDSIDQLRQELNTSAARWSRLNAAVARGSGCSPRSSPSSC